MNMVNFYPWRKKQKKLQTQRWIILSLFYLCPITISYIYLFLAVTELSLIQQSRYLFWQEHAEALFIKQQKMLELRSFKQKEHQRQQYWQKHLQTRNRNLIRLLTIFNQLPNGTGFINIDVTKENAHFFGKTTAYSHFISYLDTLKKSELTPNVNLNYIKHEEKDFYSFSFSLPNQEGE